MCFKNPFKDKDDICFFAAIICTAIANGVAVGLPKSNILGLTAISICFKYVYNEKRHKRYTSDYISYYHYLFLSN